MEYELNKGIGQSAEFKGLKAQYLFIFAGGLLALFVVFVVMYMAGVDQWVCIAFVHGGRGPVGVHRLRRGVGLGLGVAHLPDEREVRRTRADETARQAAAPALPD